MSKWKTVLYSTGSLLLAIVTVNFLLWLAVLFGNYISGFDGEIYWELLTFRAFSKNWTRLQVVSFYLLPYIFFLIIFFIIHSKKNLFRKTGTFGKLFYSWLFLILQILVLFLPFFEILNRKGIYYALIWLKFTKTDLLIYIFLTLAFYFLTLFRNSANFSFSLSLPEGKVLQKKQISIQIIFLWFIPFFIISFLILFITAFNIHFPVNYLLIGILLTLLLNTPYITTYNVLVK